MADPSASNNGRHGSPLGLARRGFCGRIERDGADYRFIFDGEREPIFR